MPDSDHITLRAVEPADADFMYEVENDPEAWKYGDNVAPLSRSLLRNYALEYDANPYSAGQLRLIACSGDGNPVGIADLYGISPRHGRAFAGIYILPAFRQRGYGKIALQSLVSYGRSAIALRIIAAEIDATNTASVKLFESAGFKRVALMPDWLQPEPGQFSDMAVYAYR